MKYSNKIKNFEKFINEKNDNSEIDIRNIFYKYKVQLIDEFQDEHKIYGLRKSLELIGDGEIIEKSKYDLSGDRLMYKEFFNNNKLILVVHAALKMHPYGEEDLYCYDIIVARNNPRSEQIGGGYGTGGYIEINHTYVLHTGELYCRNQNVISETCLEIKKYAEENF